MTVTSSAIISASGSPDRVNEDSWAIVEDPTPPGWVTAAVIDGASVRGLLPSLEDYLGKHADGLQPAVWATGIVRRAFYHSFTSQPAASPREALLMANRALRSALEAVPGILEVYQLLEHWPIELLPDVLQHSSKSLTTELSQVFSSLFPPERWQQLDTRYLRLLLPACVSTVMRLNLSSRIFDFAHVGDTALLKVNPSGEIHLLTQDQMGIYDDMVLELALQAVQQPGYQVDDVARAIERVPSVRETNLLNGVRHNYVNEHGQTQPSEGCGVINGLTALSDYIQTGQGVLNPGDRLYLMSDGLTLPISPPRGNPSSSVQDSLSGWAEALHQGDVPALLKHIQGLTEADLSRNIFPRIKHRDDATALLITVFP